MCALQGLDCFNLTSNTSRVCSAKKRAYDTPLVYPILVGFFFPSLMAIPRLIAVNFDTPLSQVDTLGLNSKLVCTHDLDLNALYG